MTTQMKAIFGTMMAALTFGSGCLVVSENDYDNGNDGCYQSCNDYETCQTYCDAWDCWDECWYETECDVTCTEVETVDTVTVECIDDLDCTGNNICIADRCVQPAVDAKDNAEAGLCQACEDTNDCSEEDARCVRLNYQHSTKTGEKICSRVCELDDDCPINFECVNISDEVGVPAQCLPKIDSANNGDLRTCTNNAGLECVKAKECGVGESCVNNECTAPGQGGTGGCSSDAQCASGETCRGATCVAESQEECVSRSDCSSGEVCVDAKCVQEKISCVFNSECADGKCVNGECAAGCSVTDDCGPYEYCRKPEGASAGLCEAMECRRTADCDPGNVCVDAQCVDSCSADADCGDGFSCNSNRYCERDDSVECLASAECAAEEVCVDNTCKEACGCNQDCPAGLVCDLDNGTCGQPVANDPVVTCANSCDCPSGKSCSTQGVCE